MLVKTFYKLISFNPNSLLNTNKSKYINMIKYSICKRRSLKKIKKYIYKSDLFDILSEFIQFSDLYKQYFRMDLPFDNIKFEPNLVKVKDGGFRGRKVIYFIEDEQLNLEIGAVVELGDKNKSVNLKIFNKTTNTRLDTWAAGSNHGADKLVDISDKAIRLYTNYAVNYIIKHGMEVQSK